MQNHWKRYVRYIFFEEIFLLNQSKQFLKYAQKKEKFKNDVYYLSHIKAARIHLRELRQIARVKIQTETQKLQTAEELLANKQWFLLSQFQQLFQYILKTLKKLIRNHDVYGEINQPVYGKKKRNNRGKIKDKDQFDHYETDVLRDLAKDYNLLDTDEREAMIQIITEYCAAKKISVVELFKERKQMLEEKERREQEKKTRQRNKMPTFEQVLNKKLKEQQKKQQEEEKNNNNNNQQQQFEKEFDGETDDDKEEEEAAEEQNNNEGIFFSSYQQPFLTLFSVSIFAETFEKIMINQVELTPIQQKLIAQNELQEKRKELRKELQNRQKRNEDLEKTRKKTSSTQNKKKQQKLNKKKELEEKARKIMNSAEAQEILVIHSDRESSNWIEAEESEYISDDSDSECESGEDSDDDEEEPNQMIRHYSSDSDDPNYEAPSTSESSAEERREDEENFPDGKIPKTVDVAFVDEEGRGWTRKASEEFQRLLMCLLHFVLGGQR